MALLNRKAGASVGPSAESTTMNTAITHLPVAPAADTGARAAAVPDG